MVFSDQIASRQIQTQTDFFFTGLLPYAIPPVSHIEPRRRNGHQNIVNDDDHSSVSSDFSSWSEERILENEDLEEEIMNGLL